MNPTTQFYIRYSPQGFQTSGNSLDITFDVFSQFISSSPSIITQTSPLSHTTQTVFFNGKFYAANDQKLIVFSPNSAVKMSLKRHGNNALIRCERGLFFVDLKGNLCEISGFELKMVKNLMQVTRGFVQSVYMRNFAFFNSEIYEILDDFQLRKLEIQIDFPLLFSSVNLIIDAKGVAVDLLLGVEFKNQSEINSEEMMRNCVPMEIGWILKKEWFESKYGEGIYDGIRERGSQAFQEFFKREFEWIKVDNGVE